MSNALDETMHRQAFEMSGYLARGQAGELALDVEMAKAGGHVLAAYRVSPHDNPTKKIGVLGNLVVNRTSQSTHRNGVRPTLSAD